MDGVQSIFDFDWEDWLMIHELALALRQLKRERGKKLDVLGFDACFMQGVEVAYELRDYVGYTVGSALGTPSNAWQYADVLKRVKKRPHSWPNTVAGMVLECLKQTSVRDDQTVLSVLDLGESDKLIEAIAQLVESLEIAYGSRKLERTCINHRYAFPNRLLKMRS